jgi:hypothetical protein
VFVTSNPELLGTDDHLAPVCREQNLATSVRDSEHARLCALQSVFRWNNETPIILHNVRQNRERDKNV